MASSSERESGCEEDEQMDHLKRTFVLIGIDTHPSMFVANEDVGTTHFQNCLKACHHISDCLMMEENSSKSQFAVALTSTDYKQPLIGFANNIIDSTKSLKALIDKSIDDLKTNYMRTTNFDFASFLLFAKKQFAHINAPHATKILVFLSNDDNPVDSSSNERLSALNEARNLNLSNIGFQLVSLSEEFDFNIFYQEMYLVCKSNLVEEVCTDLDGLVDKLTNLINQGVIKNIVNFYPVKGDNEKFFKCYRLDYITTAKLHDNAKISRDGNPVLVQRTRKENVNLQIVPDVVVTPEERHLALQGVPCGLTLYLVYNQISQIGATLGTPFLLAKHEKANPKWFDSFWQYCVNRDKVLICYYRKFANSKTSFVELIPKFANDTKMFLVQYLPHYGEIDDVVAEKCNKRLTQRDIDLMRQVVKRMEFNYDPSMFPNLSYAKKKAYVKSKLLGENSDEEITDDSGEQEVLQEKLADLVDELKTSFDWENDKRKATSSTRDWNKKFKQ